MVSQSIYKMQLAVEAIPEQDKYAYCQAQLHLVPQNNTYICDQVFFLKFLRAEIFDPQLAAKRYCSNLNLIMNYFGLQGLARPGIQLRDLSEEEMEVLRAGNASLLPCRDRAGRRVVILVGANGAGHSVRTKVGKGLVFLERIINSRFVFVFWLETCAWAHGVVKIIFQSSSAISFRSVCSFTFGI